MRLRASTSFVGVEEGPGRRLGLEEGAAGHARRDVDEEIDPDRGDGAPARRGGGGPALLHRKEGQAIAGLMHHVAMIRYHLRYGNWRKKFNERYKLQATYIYNMYINFL